MIKFGHFNDYFGNRRSFFSKSYVDYFINDIQNKNKLTEEEEKIFNKAKLKYYGLISINFLIFFYSTRRIYKKGLLELQLKKDNLKIREGFIFTTIFSMCSMIYIYKLSHRIYYNDLKYIVKKYCYVNEEQFKNAFINNKIAEMYKDKLDIIEQNS